LHLSASAAGLPRGKPEEAGMDGAHLARIDDIVAQGLAEKRMPGCVVCIGRRGKIVLLKAYGDRQIKPSAVPMTTDTVFDLASITKPVATATSIMLLVERGQLKLGQRVAELIPEFAANEKGEITIFDLLTHQSGLLPDNALADYENGPDEALKKICELKLQAPLGTRFIYSDVISFCWARSSAVRATSRCTSSRKRTSFVRSGCARRATCRRRSCGGGPRQPKNATDAGCKARFTIRGLSSSAA
jgi:CubicO group peptidase (beta-lactamase class C family)